MFFTRWLLSPTRRRSRSLLAGQLGEAGLQGDRAAERLRCGGYGTANSARVFEIGTAGLSPQVTHKQPMLARWIIRAGSRVEMAADWSGGAPDKDRSTRLATRGFTLDGALVDVGRRTGGAAVGSSSENLDTVAKDGVVVDSGKHGGPLRDSSAAERGESRRVPERRGTFDQNPLG